MYAENESVAKRNEAVINDLPGEIYTTEASDKIADNCKYPLAAVQATQNQKEINTGSLEKLLKFKDGAKVMLTVDLDMQDRLISSQTGI